MKKLIFATIIIFLSSVSVFARYHNQVNSSPATGDSSLSQLLTLYYNVKDALVAGNAETAATKAGEFVKVANAIDNKTLSKKANKTYMGLQKKLVFDATHISETKDIAHQREHFANFSTNIFILAKAVKLTAQPVYEQYCPMKKSYWLSNESAIKNPYYGNSMLTCGKVVETIK